MRTVLFLLAICTVGCDQNSLKPAPKIEVQIQDNTDNTTVIVHYRHHSISENREACEYLSTPEEIRHYKEQVEFLLKRLDEAEIKMKVHEPENETE